MRILRLSQFLCSNLSSNMILELYGGFLSRARTPPSSLLGEALPPTGGFPNSTLSKTSGKECMVKCSAALCTNSLPLQSQTKVDQRGVRVESSVSVRKSRSPKIHNVGVLSFLRLLLPSKQPRSVPLLPRQPWVPPPSRCAGGK